MWGAGSRYHVLVAAWLPEVVFWKLWHAKINNMIIWVIVVATIDIFSLIGHHDVFIVGFLYCCLSLAPSMSFLLSIMSFDNFYRGLSPYEPCVSSGFVFISDQVCSQGSLVIRSMVKMYFSHGFGLYSCLFGVIQVCSGFPSSTPMFHAMEYRHCIIALWIAMFWS